LAVPLNGFIKQRLCYGEVKLRQRLRCLATATENKRRTFVSICVNINNESVNYEYFQAEGLYSIGSGAVESAIKQISRRVQLSGAQWNRENVPQVLAHRCAYLNGLIGSPLPTS